MNKFLYALSVIVLIIAIVFSINNTAPTTAQNVSIVNGQQIIEISAKGGYSPAVTEAQANLPTTIKINTRGTFDCSAALSIPTLAFQQTLPFNGVTEIPLTASQATGTLQGRCSMGMYGFKINFS